MNVDQGAGQGAVFDFLIQPHIKYRDLVQVLFQPVGADLGNACVRQADIRPVRHVGELAIFWATAAQIGRNRLMDQFGVGQLHRINELNEVGLTGTATNPCVESLFFAYRAAGPALVVVGGVDQAGIRSCTQPVGGGVIQSL